MKSVFFSDEAREKLKKGVDLIANSVKITLGPRGRNMIYGNRYGYSILTKDGVTVARQVDARDEAEQLGLVLIRQVAQKTADDVGDGTTTATLLAQEVFNEGLKVLKSGANPILIKRGIDKAVEEVVEYIDSIKISVSENASVHKVATLSANNDPALGQLVCDAINKVGFDGVITLEDSHGVETFIDMVEGMQLNEGLVSAYFVTDPAKMEATYQNAYVIIIDGDVHNVNQVVAVMQEAIKTGRPVILMANQVNGQVLQALVQSKMQNSLPLAVVKSPYFADYRSEQLIDLAILTGGKVIGHTTGLRPEEATLADLGQCQSFKATRYYATFVGGFGKKEDVDGRITVIKNMIDQSESDYEKEKLRERLSKLTSGVAVIKVGAPTEVEQKEKKMRVEDALLAARAAIEDGIVPGGGLALLRASNIIQEIGEEEELIGRRIVKKALRAPIKQIAANAGLDGSEIIANIVTSLSKAENYGYNFLTNQYGDLINLGVIDPAKVVKTTLINAASVAGLLLTTEVCCSEDEEAEVARLPKQK